MSWISEYPQVATLMAAELIFVLTRSADIQIVCKAPSQRTAAEQKLIARGLRRSLGLECLVFVPASAVLLVMMAPMLMPSAWQTFATTAGYAALGTVSYGFPFAAIRAVVKRIALATLKEFASISSTPPEPAVDDEKR